MVPAIGPAPPTVGLSPSGGAPLAPWRGDVSALLSRLRAVRRHSEALIAPLEPEDLCLQGMADASPPKWHLGHTTWFFDIFVLSPHLEGWPALDQRWGFLFNSYYDAVGARHPRPQRGLLTRPPMDAVLRWRRRVDEGLERLLAQLDGQPPERAARPLELLELGVHHEQQHQELLLMDLLDGFSRNPLEPAYRLHPEDGPRDPAPVGLVEPGWLTHPGGLVEIGHDNPQAFAFDNEGPRHRVWLEPFALSRRLVSNADYAAFIADGGYRRPELWMSEGWAIARERGWSAPRYWREENGEFTLSGRQPLHPDAPVRHLSWFEAEAYARWAGARLPSEAEWEQVASGGDLPAAFDSLWQWTATPYRPYPGYQPEAGAVGEYNGKFMSSQFVLRGSATLTPPGHARLTYRNFFSPESRWMASGLRLAREATP
ncbi:MAG: ergothioneine biosynthesis protein EgtB [Cyanobacteria bacterium K_Offshore_surface_m2_239]|nr:ergothioneine biosynthesis protein EgtB [Cyanobacteria bacterium K_Offshore_surface_m2_239]